MRKSYLHNTKETLFPFLLVSPMSYFYTYLGGGSFRGNSALVGARVVRRGWEGLYGRPLVPNGCQTP